MFEQFKENIELAGETSISVRRGFRSGFDAIKNAPRARKALWLSVVGAILVNSIADSISVAWFYKVVLVIVIVVLPLSIWVASADGKDS